MKLHGQQFLAITRGDLDTERFDMSIHSANLQKQRAKYDYLQHLEDHGCSTDHDVHKSGARKNYR